MGMNLAGGVEYIWDETEINKFRAKLGHGTGGLTYERNKGDDN